MAKKVKKGKSKEKRNGQKGKSKRKCSKKSRKTKKRKVLQKGGFLKALNKKAADLKQNREYYEKKFKAFWDFF